MQVKFRLVQTVDFIKDCNDLQYKEILINPLSSFLSEQELSGDSPKMKCKFSMRTLRNPSMDNNTSMDRTQILQQIRGAH